MGRSLVLIFLGKVSCSSFCFAVLAVGLRRVAILSWGESNGDGDGLGADLFGCVNLQGIMYSNIVWLWYGAGGVRIVPV